MGRTLLRMNYGMAPRLTSNTLEWGDALRTLSCTRQNVKIRYGVLEQNNWCLLDTRIQRNNIDSTTYQPSVFVKSRDVVFHEDPSCFKPAAEKIFFAFIVEIEEPAVSRSSSQEPSEIPPLPQPPPPTTGREIRRLLPVWVRKRSSVSHGESTTLRRRAKTPKLS